MGANRGILTPCAVISWNGKKGTGEAEEKVFSQRCCIAPDGAVGRRFGRSSSMSRFLGCGCYQRPRYEVEPTVWAGRQNVWKRVMEMSDEFKGVGLSKRKWYPYSPFSFGTCPGLFVPGNVSVREGTLRLTARADGVPEDAPTRYWKWTTSAVVSQYASLYGYFECCFRASNTSLASRFALSGGDGDKRMEVNVFSYSASRAHKEIVYMDAKYSQKDEDGRHQMVKHPLKKVIFDMPEAPVTVGIDWTPDHLKTYVDGHVIRHLENRHWHAPMHICFMLETVPRDFGLPEGDSLGPRDDFEIYYIRTWHRFPNERQNVSPGVQES